MRITIQCRYGAFLANVLDWQDEHGADYFSLNEIWWTYRLLRVFGTMNFKPTQE